MIIDDEPPQEIKNTNPRLPLPPLNPTPHLFSSLPNEIVENILARVSKWYYRNVSLVSKRFRSFLFSPELYKTRSRLGTTEPCIYICLENSEEQPPRLFALFLKPPDETLTEDDDLPYDDYSLVPFPVPSPEQFMSFNSIVAVGSEIYLIGQDFCLLPTSDVRILDCKSNTWRDGPSMLVARKSPYAVFLDDKIYVMGGCGEDDTWMEVLDIKTKTWSPLMRHRGNVFEIGWFNRMIVLDGKIHSIGHINSYAYDTKEGTWEVVETNRSFSFIVSWCVIGDVTYGYNIISGYIVMYDSKNKNWIHIKGLDMGKRITDNLAEGCVFELLNYGGKLLVMRVPNFTLVKWKRRIWCAIIALEKHHENEVWGKIERHSSVMTVSKSYRRSKCVVISI